MLRAIRRARIYKVCGGAQQPILNKLSIQCQGVGQRDRFVLLRRTLFEPNKRYVAEHRPTIREVCGHESVQLLYAQSGDDGGS